MEISQGDPDTDTVRARAVGLAGRAFHLKVVEGPNARHKGSLEVLRAWNLMLRLSSDPSASEATR